MTQYDEDPTVYNGHFELEVLIDRPVEQVWAQFFDIPSWVLTHEIDLVSGARGTVGSITQVFSRNAREEGYHYCKLIKLVPGERWILKIYSERGDEYDFTGFDDGRLVPVDNKSKVIFNIFIEVRGESIAKDPGVMNLDISRENMMKNLNNLKQIIENR